MTNNDDSTTGAEAPQQPAAPTNEEQRYFGPGTGPNVDPTAWSGPTAPWSGPSQPAPTAARRSPAVLITVIVCATLVVIALIAGVTYALTSSNDSPTPSTAAASTTTAAVTSKSAADRATCVAFADASASINTDPAINARPADPTAPEPRAAWAASMRRIMDRTESQIASGTSAPIDTSLRKWISMQRDRATKVQSGTLQPADSAAATAQANLVQAVCA